MKAKETTKVVEVFCGVCAYFNRLGDKCCHPNNMAKSQEYWREGKMISIREAKIINKNNDCGWFSAMTINTVSENKTGELK